jgi:hypothetical protein
MRTLRAGLRARPGALDLDVGRETHPFPAVARTSFGGFERADARRHDDGNSDGDALAGYHGGTLRSGSARDELTPDGMHIVDVWDSQAMFEQFLQTRLMPAVQKLKIPGQPKLEFFPAYNTFAPNP